MGFPQSSHAYADMRRPEPWFCCDRCGFRYNYSRARWQWDWRGNSIQNLRILVDHRCEDVPNSQLRPVLIGPDPYPVRDPRPGFAQSQMGPQPPVQTPLEIITDGEGLGPGPLPPLFGLINDGGVLQVSSPNNWPTSPVGLAPGDLWSLGGVAYMVTNTRPNPAAPPVLDRKSVV